MKPETDWATGKPIDISKPEELVRQEYEKILHEDYGYAKQQMDIEVRIQRGSQNKERADIVIYKTKQKHKRDQGKDILGIVETKKVDRRDGVEQLTSYMTATCCSWGVWTNGEEIEYLYKVPSTGEVKREAIYQIPKKGESFEDIGGFTKEGLIPASNLKLIFRRLLNTLYTNTNISRREKLGNEMIRLIFCKIYDEIYEVSGLPKFRVGISDEKNGFKDVEKRIKELFKDVKSNLVKEGIFENNEKISLDKKSLAYVVGELQIYSLTNTDQDIVGDAFEVFAESKFVGEKGEFFTPRQVVRIAIDIINPKPEETIADPACGSGGFLIFALEHIWTQMTKAPKWKGQSKKVFEKEKARIAQHTVYGIDKEIDLVKITKAYMAIIGDGKSRIVQQNSLHEPSDFIDKAKEFFVDGEGKFQEFDVILTNPPFGSKETKVLESESRNFDLGHKWKKADNSNRFEKTNKVKKTPAQELFIERCFNMLKSGGRMAIVLPETYFHAPTKKHVIQYIENGNNIRAVIDLPHNTFRPHCNAKTLMLVVEKDRPQDEIIFGVCEEIGKDHLGKIKKRPDKHGHITDEVWDDSKHIREELKTPGSSKNRYVFVVPPSKIKDHIYVPRYYWNTNVRKLRYKARQIDSDLVPVSELIDKEIIEVFRGHGSPPNEYKGLGDIPYVRAGDIGNWSVYKNPTSGVPVHVYEQVKKNKVNLQEKDLIFVKEGSYRIGDVALILPTDTEILLNSHCFVLRVIKLKNEYDVDPYYLTYLFSHEIVKQQLNKKVFIDTTLPNIGNRWKELLLPISRDIKIRRRYRDQVKEVFRLRQKAENIIAEIPGKFE